MRKVKSKNKGYIHHEGHEGSEESKAKSKNKSYTHHEGHEGLEG
jgi:hypothetical protein